MTPIDEWHFAQLCKRLTPRTPEEADLIVRGIAHLEREATWGMGTDDKR
jgi:hypothetical protein